MNANLDDELIQDYLAECLEHLGRIENDLLAIEQAGADIDEQVVNQVFRAAHSIKGGAGFFGLNKIRELAHKIENVLDLIRSRQMVPQPEIVSMLLMSFDKLRELVGNYRESNQADIAEFVLALTNLTVNHLEPGQKLSVDENVSIATPTPGRLIQTTALDLKLARRGGKCIYLVEYDLIHDMERRGKTPLDVFRDLMKCGTMLETVVDFQSVGTLEDAPSDRLMLEVLYATVLEPDLVSQVLDLPGNQVHVLEKDGSSKPLSASGPAPVMAAEVTPKVEAPAKVTAAPIVEAPPASKPEAAKPPAAAQSTPEATIRLNVSLLDSLMTLAGELVLSRNQLNESLAHADQRGIQAGAQRVSLATSELQAVVTLTRMQPVGNLFGKFPRLVRDLARELGKDIHLEMVGDEVEIDKTILEGLSDPLTHMMRNAADHGIETPAKRAEAGKPAAGRILLKASHQAGQVVIEIGDDGKGLDAEKIAASTLAKGLVTREQLQGMPDRDKIALIFLPGVSTAEKVTGTSGRGVGMDVVKTNLDKLGGKVEIESVPGRGSTFRIKLPLTLAIIPSLLVSHGGERYAIPQVNVGELIRIPAAQLGERVSHAADAEVLIVRDRLVPLLHLAEVLGLRGEGDGNQAVNVVLVNTGTFEYGLVVENLHDTVEIVVKPLGRHFKGVRDYAGATILGDGRVALILDVAGLAERTGLSYGQAQGLSKSTGAESGSGEERQSLLLFQNAPSEVCAVPIELVSRIERVRPEQVENLAGRRTMQYQGASIPLVTLRDTAAVGELSEAQRWVVVIFEIGGSPVGLLAAEPLDMVEAVLKIDQVTLRQPGLAGSAILQGRTTLILNIFELAGNVRPEWGAAASRAAIHGPEATCSTVLVAEDSEFFRGQIRRLIEAVGYRVLDAEDGQAAWELLDRHAGEIALVATDVEMPRMDGLALTRQIRADGRFDELPVIALSALAGEEEVARGMAAGVSEYQVKLDPEEFVQSVRRAVGGHAGDVVAEQCFSGR
jgi:two-component system chemotaxis sensor kinase CheA